MNAREKSCLWKLDSLLTTMHFTSSIPQLLRKHDCTTNMKLADLTMLQLFSETFPKYYSDARFAHLFICSMSQMDRIFSYRYKVKYNLAGLKNLLASDFFKKNNYFYFSEWFSFVKFMLVCYCAEYIENNFCPTVLLPERIQKNIEIRKFNEAAEKYNAFLRNNSEFVEILSLHEKATKKLVHERGNTDFDVIKFFSPAITDITMSLLNASNKFFLRTLYLSLLNYGLYSSLLTLLFNFFESEADYLHGIAVSVLRKVAVIGSLLYGIYFYYSVSPYFNQLHRQNFICTPNEIKEILNRSDIEIVS